MSVRVVLLDSSALPRTLDVRILAGLVVYVAVFLPALFWDVRVWVLRSVVAFVGLGVLLALAFVLSRFLGSRTLLAGFLPRVVYAAACALTVALAALLLSAAMQYSGFVVPAKMLVSILPVYVGVMFAWAVDQSSRLEGKANWSVGLICAAGFSLLWLALAGL